MATNLNKDGIVSTQQTIDIAIDDSLSGVKTYDGFINGVWALFEYDFKSKKMRHQLSEDIIKTGKNDLKVVVTDHVGNTTIFEKTFTYKKP